MAQLLSYALKGSKLFIIISKISKIIKTFMFSEIVRPKMGLIDPGPLTPRSILDLLGKVLGLFIELNCYLALEVQLKPTRQRYVPNLSCWGAQVGG